MANDAVPGYVCGSCGFAGNQKRITKGSFLVELVLWLMFLFPGVLYSVWRLASRYDGCPKCGKPSMIPTDAPMGRKMLADMRAGNGHV